MSFVNLYKPPQPSPKLTEPSDAPYPITFNMPIPHTLSTDRVKLVPFIPKLHAKIFHEGYVQNPQTDEHIPVPWLDYSALLHSLETFYRGPSELLFAVIDRTKPNDGVNLQESLAGMIGLMRSAPEKLMVELGPVIILPAWQRTFVSTHAIGLLLKSALSIPREGGVGYRRVIWVSSIDNKGSTRAAERMGFKREAVLRWSRVLPPGKKGEVVDGKRGETDGLHSILLAVCWDDWENGGKELVEEQMNRK